MLKLKRNVHVKLKTPPVTASNLVPSPLNGVVPPVEHRFKAGAEWKGNRNGRPAVVRSAYRKAMNKLVEDSNGKKRPWIEVAAENMILQGCGRLLFG